MASGYAVTKLNMQGHVQWNAAAPTGFLKNFNGGSVCGINHDMKRIDGGEVMVGYGSADWEGTDRNAYYLIPDRYDDPLWQ